MIAEIVAQNSKGRDVLVAVVTGSLLAPKLTAQYFEILERECPSIPFEMVVDLEEIHIKKQGCEPRPDSYRTLSAREVFRRYDPEYGSKRIFHHYLVTLADVWLHDLARRWKLTDPPGSRP